MTHAQTRTPARTDTARFGDVESDLFPTDDADLVADDTATFGVGPWVRPATERMQGGPPQVRAG